jgi:carbon-monoxide dehydrogenase medium subunit
VILSLTTGRGGVVAKPRIPVYTDDAPSLSQPPEASTVLSRPSLPAFDYVRATSPDQAIALLQEFDARARLLMGGTDLFVRMRDGFMRPEVLVDVKHLRGWKDVTSGAAGLTIGAAVTMNQLARHPIVRLHYPLLAEAAASVASYQLRNRATFGGNLCNGSPAADTAPALLALQGRLLVQGPAGAREVEATDFFRGPGRTALRGDELLAAIRLPALPKGAIGHYIKLGRNKAGDLAIAGVAVLGFPDRTAASGYRFHIALASVAPVPLRATAAEELLASGPAVPAAIDEAAQKAMEAASPIDDVRASAAYRRAMVRNLTRRGLRQVYAELQSSLV